jgi:thiol-disulfide isomerase/thioredoxin
MPRVFSALPLLLILTSGVIQGQQSLPGCEPPATLSKTIKDQLESPEFRRLNYQQQEERRRRVLSELFAKYPREIAAYRYWIRNAQFRRQYGSEPAPLAAIQRQLREREAAHPDDPLALDLYASALRGTDTPESIRLLQRAQSLAPNFVWSSVDVAQIYSSGKFADKRKFAEEVTKFWTACPTSQDLFARWMLVKVPELQAQVAKAERAALAKETNPDRLKDYEFLWGLEFRTTPPQNFPQLRQQVAADLKRLNRARNPHVDAAWANLLIQGSRQAGEGAGSITAREDSLIAKYPHSNEAYHVTYKRWEKAHPEPPAQDVAAWKTYRVALKAEQQSEFETYPDSLSPAAFYRFAFTRGDDSIDEEQGLAMADAALSACLAQFGPSDDCAGSIGENLLEHGWAPERALLLLEQSRQAELRNNEDYLKQDDHSDSELTDYATLVANGKRQTDAQILLAAMRAHRPDAVAASIKTSVEAPRAADDKDESAYWLRRARLAAIEGQQQDALGYYQLALRTRAKPPGYERGKLTDNLSDEAHALWTQRGGSEVAWSAWSAPTTQPNAAKADDARWEKPTKTLPTFELADLSGKTWSVKNLNGKVVLINLWATWCGPCNAELPQLQKLYEQAKGRSDIQVLTFNIDEDLGLVEPFMKEKGYTFPVVPAYSYVVNLLDGYAIPQNWLLDPKGQWTWTQIGYGSDDAWVTDMLAKLDAVKAGS